MFEYQGILDLKLDDKNQNKKNYFSILKFNNLRYYDILNQNIKNIKKKYINIDENDYLIIFNPDKTVFWEGNVKKILLDDLYKKIKFSDGINDYYRSYAKNLEWTLDNYHPDDWVKISLNSPFVKIISKTEKGIFEFE